MPHEPIPGPLLRADTRPPAEAYAVLRAVRVLERLAVRPGSAPELSATIGAGERSTRRLLRRLRAEGYVVQDAGHRRRYRPTPRLGALGAIVLHRHPVIEAAAPVLVALARDTKTTAALWVGTGRHAVRVLRADPGDDPPQRTLQVGGARGLPVRAVLAPTRVASRSHTFERANETPTNDDGAGGGTAATAVLDRGTVAAAIEVTGNLPITVATELAAAADRLRAALPAAVRATDG